MSDIARLTVFLGGIYPGIEEHVSEIESEIKDFARAYTGRTGQVLEVRVLASKSPNPNYTVSVAHPDFSTEDERDVTDPVWEIIQKYIFQCASE